METRGKSARNLLGAFLFWCVGRNVDVIASYLRTNRDVAGDEITRLPEERLKHFAIIGERKGALGEWISGGMVGL